MTKVVKKELKWVIFTLIVAVAVMILGVFIAYSNSRAVCLGDVRDFSQYMSDFELLLFKIGQTFVSLPI